MDCWNIYIFLSITWTDSDLHDNFVYIYISLISLHCEIPPMSELELLAGPKNKD